MIIKIILGIIAIISGLTAIKGFHAASSIEHIYFAFNSLIFVVCLGFINTPHKTAAKEGIEKRIDNKSKPRMALINKNPRKA